MNKKKLLKKILTNKQNVSFSDFKNLIEAFGFRMDRINGSHHIFVHPFVKELINIQNIKGQVKPYQINQFLTLVEKHNLSLKEKE
ncbi:MAG: type II toxin-antitoxin system HicA family toxin [Ignavibacteriales bacterium]|nr:type II toxin-antitoxin system HicA family toxin [Ignavibacteriales bacterium]